MDSLFQQLPNGGAVVALITVVVIFLRRQDKYDDRLEAIVKHFNDEISTSRRDYLEHLRELVDRPGKTKP